MKKSPPTEENEELDGVIKNVRKKSPKKNPKIEEALAQKMQGGSIKNPKKKSPRKKPKIDEAIQEQFKRGGRVKFHDPVHKYLMGKLSGRGGTLDSSYCREKMHQLMSAYHPSLFQSYLSGQVRDVPQHRAYHMKGPPRAVRNDVRPTVVDTGGSLRSISHSENGYLQSYDSTFYNHVELV